MTNKCNNISSCSAYLIWRNYAIGASAISLVPIVSYAFQNKVVPFLALVLSLALFAFVRHNRRSRSETCVLIPYIVARVLLVYAFASYLVAIMAKYSTETFWGDALERLPYFTIMFLSALTAVLTTFVYKRHFRNVFCMDCLLRNGTPYERELLGHIYFKENRFLLPRIIKITSLLALITWTCYFICDVESGEISGWPLFVFVFSPVVFLVFDLVALRLRYWAIGVFYRKKLAQEDREHGGHSKLVRILLICGDRLYLTEKDGKYDTPFQFTEPFSEAISLGNTVQYMSREMGYVQSDFVRFCYGSMDLKNRRSVEHYFCFIDNCSSVDNAKSATDGNGRWWTKSELEGRFQKSFSKILCAELHRVYTVMLTSKLYNADGSKIVQAKGYIPDFQINEIRTSTVDFSNNRWMILSKFNKDLSFRLLKKVWYQYIEGLK